MLIPHCLVDKNAITIFDIAVRKLIADEPMVPSEIKNVVFN